MTITDGPLEVGPDPQPRWKSHRVRAAIAVTLKYLSLIAASLVMLVPVVVVFTTSLKTSAEMSSGDTLSLPHNWFNYHNYVTAFQEGAMLRGFESSRRKANFSTSLLWPSSR